jgi:syntaxin 1B/2/3
VTIVLIIVIIVVAVVAYVMVNRAANGGGGGGGGNNNSNNASGNTNNNAGGTTDSNNAGGQKRGLLQRNVLDDLQMNTGRAVNIATESTPAGRHSRSPDADVTSSLRLSRRRSNRARGKTVAPERAKRFVVDWQGADPTGSDD